MPVAIGAFFALDAIIVALVLTLWFFATIAFMRPIVTFLARLLSNIPAIGDTLANAVLSLEDNLVGHVQGLIRDAYQAGAQPIVEMMNTYANTHSGDAYSQRLVMSRVTSAVITATEAAHNRVNQPTQTYVTDGTTVNNTYVTNYVDNTTTVSEGYTQASYEQLAGWASTAIQVAYDNIGAVNGRVDAANQYTADSFTAANDYAATVANAAQTDAITAATDYTNAQVTTAEEYTTQVRDYATAANAQTQEWAQGYVTEHEDSLKSEMTAALTGVAAIATTVATDFARFKNDCGDPLCDGLLGFAKHFSGLKKLLETGLLVGFLVEAATDPEGTADAAIAVADAVTSPAKDLYHTIFGE